MFALIVFIGCKEKSHENIPEISDLFPVFGTVYTNSVDTLYCIITEENTNLDFRWNSENGRLFSVNNFAIWLSPDTVGDYWISCECCNSSNECDRDTTFVTVTSPPDTIIRGISEFPNTIGTYWTYARKDSIYYNHTVINDTVTILIDSLMFLENDQVASYWTEFYNHYLFNSVVFERNDTIYFYELIDNEWLNFSFYFPLPIRIGNEWSPSQWETFHVDSIEIIEVPAGVFNYCFRIMHQIFAHNDVSSEIYWYQPYIGIIKYFEHDYLTIEVASQQDIEWTLIDYGINY